MDTRNPQPDERPYAEGELAPSTNAEMFWRRAAQAATVGIFLLMAGAFLDLARAVFLPFTAAFVIGTLLGPVTERARARGVPQLLSALFIVLLVIAVMNVLVVLLAAPVSDWISKAPEIGARLKDKLSLLDYPLQWLRSLRDTLNPGGDHSAPLDLGLSNLVQPALSLLTPALGFVTPAIGQLLIFFGALFFFLSARTELRRGVSMLFGDRETRLRVLHIMHEAESNLTTYFTTLSAIYFVEGIAVGIACFFIGLPNAAAWGALTFVLCFIPYIGPALGGFDPVRDRPHSIPGSNACAGGAGGLYRAGDARRHLHHAGNHRPQVDTEPAGGVFVAGVLGLVVGPGRRFPRHALAHDRACGHEPDLSPRRKRRCRVDEPGAPPLPSNRDAAVFPNEAIFLRHGFLSLRRSRHRLRARPCRLGAGGRLCARLRGVARLHLVADPGLERAGGDRRAARLRAASISGRCGSALRSAPPPATGCLIGWA